MTSMDSHRGESPRRHFRSQSVGARGVGDRNRPGKQPSQKAMLSEALQKANTAVKLDNSGKFEDARLAYVEACELLEQVLERISGEDDRNKLEAIVSELGSFPSATCFG
jgi:hypothetical protein